MADRVSKIMDDLLGEEERLLNHLSHLKSQVASCNGNLKRIRSGISALGGNPNGQSAKPAPTKKCVADAIASILSRRSPMMREQLKSAVEEAIVVSGFSRAGFALRFEESVAAPRFRRTESGYVIAAALESRGSKTETK